MSVQESDPLHVETEGAEVYFLPSGRPLVTVLMRSCLPEFKPAHFAIGKGLMNISGVLTGVVSA